MSDTAPVGRPPDYRPEFAEQAGKLCALGATDFELADFFGVTTTTIYRWKNTHAEFCEAVIVGKEPANERVERSLYNRAVGYSYESEDIRVVQGEIKRTPIVEHVPPEPGAAFNWLKNRKPDAWRDRREVTGKDGEPLAGPPADPRELAKAIVAVLGTAVADEPDKDSE